MTVPLAFPRQITTPRLELRAGHPSFAAQQRSAVTESLPELARWMPWAQHAPTLEETIDNLVECDRAFGAGTQFDWLILESATPVMIGRISVFAIDPDIPKGEIGYWLHTTRTGAGYMSEAAAAVRDAALDLGFRRLEIRCDALNVRSAAVAQRTRFTLDGVLRNDVRSAQDPTELRDTAIYSLTT